MRISKQSIVKIITMGLTVGVVLVNLFLVNNLERLRQQDAERYNEALWFLFQLNKEFKDLTHEAELYSLGHMNLDKVMLAYDVTWSRFDILLNSKEAQRFQEYDYLLMTFTQAFSRFKTLETTFARVENGKLTAQELFEAIRRQHFMIIDELNGVFMMKNPVAMKQVEVMNQQYKTVKGTLAASLVLFFGVIWVLWHDRQHHHRLATADPLTQLSNRLAMNQALTNFTAQQTPFSLILIDLNHFKYINDTYGHPFADKLLISLAQRLRTIADSDSECYRIGGDEFVLLHRSHTELNLDEAVSALEHHISTPIILDGKSLVVTASIGAAQYPLDADDTESLMLIADQRMYREKHRHHQCQKVKMRG
uniref:GGDEF domain-containing protein n=1 Tax=Thaumasiovibrio occultus TaxID=1891184 RepID=UPI000B35BB23|nr:GGDEF domain-containing protein [Thaumasiovibrio occultus]